MIEVMNASLAGFRKTGFYSFTIFAVKEFDGCIDVSMNVVPRPQDRADAGSAEVLPQGFGRFPDQLRLNTTELMGIDRLASLHALARQAG